MQSSITLKIARLLYVESKWKVPVNLFRSFEDASSRTGIQVDDNIYLQLCLKPLIKNLQGTCKNLVSTGDTTSALLPESAVYVGSWTSIRVMCTLTWKSGQYCQSAPPKKLFKRRKPPCCVELISLHDNDGNCRLVHRPERHYWRSCENTIVFMNDMILMKLFDIWKELWLKVVLKSHCSSKNIAKASSLQLKSFRMTCLLAMRFQFPARFICQMVVPGSLKIGQGFPMMWPTHTQSVKYGLEFLFWAKMCLCDSRLCSCFGLLHWRWLDLLWKCKTKVSWRRRLTLVGSAGKCFWHVLARFEK